MAGMIQDAEGLAVAPLLEAETPDIESQSSRCQCGCVLRTRGCLRRIAHTYDSWLQSRPLLVKSVTAFFILGAADMVGQAVQGVRGQGGGSLDVLRTTRFAIFGLVLQAPWNHFYYLLLDGALPPTEYPWTKRTFVKVIIDQFIQAPIFTVLIFVFLGVLQGHGIHEIETQLEDEYWSTMIANCKYSMTR